MAQIRLGMGIFGCLLFSDGFCLPLPVIRKWFQGGRNEPVYRARRRKSSVEDRCWNQHGSSRRAVAFVSPARKRWEAVRRRKSESALADATSLRHPNRASSRSPPQFTRARRRCARPAIKTEEQPRLAPPQSAYWLSVQTTPMAKRSALMSSASAENFLPSQ